MPPYALGVPMPNQPSLPSWRMNAMPTKQLIRSSFVFGLDCHQIDDVVLLKVAQVGSKFFKKCQMQWFQCKVHRSIPTSTDWLNYYKFRLYASSERCPMLRVNDLSGCHSALKGYGMERRKLLQEMGFEEAYSGWNEGRLTQFEAGQLLCMCERSFRGYLKKYEAEGLEGLIDHRREQLSKVLG